MCDYCSCPGPHAQEGLAFGFLLRSFCLTILSHFIFDLLLVKSDGTMQRACEQRTCTHSMTAIPYVLFHE